MPGILRPVIAVLALTMLSACDSAEERAEKHYQNALELLDEGDTQRALVEFRNVFALDASHREARLAYAKAARSIGNISESYASYLQVAEQFPDDMAVRITLTEMAILAQNWDEAERHGKAILASSDAVEGREIPLLALEFRQAVLDNDKARMRELTREAEDLTVDNPDNEILARILVEGYLNDNEIDKAIAVADGTIARNPDSLAAYRVKATLLGRNQDIEGLEAHLRETITRFPDDQDTKQLLIRIFAQQGALDDAEDFLRSEIERADDKLLAHVTLITFIRQANGLDAALAEIDSAVGLYEDSRLLKALKAGMVFDLGRKDEAVSLLQSVIDESEPGEDTDQYRVALARMLVATGNEVGARQLIEGVLANDPNQVEALKISANWLIESDKADDAINALRRALDQAPEDADAMTLMARAHERNGNSELAQDLLALAVEASGNAPDESLRFARLLIGQQRYSAAESALINALRVDPGNVSLLQALGQVYLETADWSRAQGVENALRRQDAALAKLAADELRLKILSRSEGRERGLAYLEQLAEQEDGSATAKIALIRARLTDGRNDEAVALARELVDELRENPRAVTILGNTQFAIGDFAGAEETFASITTDTDDAGLIMQYARVLGAQGKSREARDIVDRSLERLPDSDDLLWAKATFLEQDNDIAGAIGIYERLYEKNSNSPIVANNLASLLATYTDDDASLERAFTVARRLKGTTVPAFQDTYGWIVFRRGDAEEAVTYLEPAAAALTDDPIVQYHLARAYQALGRNEDARTAYQATLSIAGADDPRDQIADASKRIEEMAAASGE